MIITFLSSHLCTVTFTPEDINNISFAENFQYIHVNCIAKSCRAGKLGLSQKSATSFGNHPLKKFGNARKFFWLPVRFVIIELV